MSILLCWPSTVVLLVLSVAGSESVHEIVDFNRGQHYNLFDIDDEPSNLCTGEFIGQLSCNRPANVRVNNHKLELVASINENAGNSFFLFNGAKMITKQSWHSGRAIIRASQPDGRYIRSMFALRTLAPNGIDWDRNHQSCMVFVQQPDTLLQKHYDKNATAVSTQLITKKIRRFKNVQNRFYNYSVEWNVSGVKWFINNHTVANQTFHEQNPSRKWHLSLQISVGGPEFADLYNALPEQLQIWPNPVLTIESIELFHEDANRTNGSYYAHIYSLILIVINLILFRI